MAGQLQVVNSKVVGVGLVAGGPYGCAETGTQGLMPSAIRMLSRTACRTRAVSLLAACQAQAFTDSFSWRAVFPKHPKWGAGHVERAN